jgi:hypothetical protein
VNLASLDHEGCDRTAESSRCQVGVAGRLRRPGSGRSFTASDSKR